MVPLAASLLLTLLSVSAAPQDQPATATAAPAASGAAPAAPAGGSSVSINPNLPQTAAPGPNGYVIP